MGNHDFLSKFEPYEFKKFGYVRLPEIKLTDEERKIVGAPADCSNFEFLKVLARKGFKEKIPKEKHTQYGERAKRELGMFEKLGFVDYVLLVWKTTFYCDQNGIARDYGRGSAAGSLIFYLLGITNVEPIRYDLFFERFVSETRAKSKVIDGVLYVDGGLAPDVDIDIEQSKRSQVIEYLKELYPARVCKIATLTTLSGKALMKETGKVVGDYKEDEMKAVANMIPKHFGIVKDIETAYKDDKKFREWCDAHPRVYSIALQLRDLIRNKGSHPSGFVIAYDPISDFLPLELVNRPKGQEGKEVAASVTMEYIAYLTIKLDLLGVRCCSVVSAVTKALGLDINTVNIDSDPIIYDNLQNLITPHGIFQLEAPTNLQVCQKVKPKNLSELSDVVAIARPGALSFLDTYSDNKSVSVHPLFDPILKSTRFVCLYQEQMMQLSHAIGFTLDEAEQLRRIVGKKKREEIAVWEEKVNNKIKENNLPQELGTLLWKILNDSASYSFNKSHALSYAALSALTTYLKFKYPLQFYCALLNEVNNEPKPLEEISKIQPELRYFGIKLLPPNLIKSDIGFKIEGNDIRFGLSSIKGVSEKTSDKIISFKHPYANKFELFEGANNAGLSIGVLSALIQSGCLDGIDDKMSRPALTAEAQLWNLLTGKGEKALCLEVGKRFNFNLKQTLGYARTALNTKGKPYIKESRWETIMKKYKEYRMIYDMNKPNQSLANFFYERMLLGYSYSSTLVDIFRGSHPDLMTLEEVNNAEIDDRVMFMGVVSEKAHEGVSQSEKKTKYCRWTVSDETGRIPCLLFNQKDSDNIEHTKRENDGKLPNQESIVYCTGVKKGDAVFLQSIKSQSIKIYTKFGDIKKNLAEKAVDSDNNSE